MYSYSGEFISEVSLSYYVGVYPKPTEEQNRKFDERIKWLENVMTPRRELYEAEEKTLRVMLAEEEEEKEKERRESERKKQGKTSPRMLATIAGPSCSKG